MHIAIQAADCSCGQTCTETLAMTKHDLVPNFLMKRRTVTCLRCEGQLSSTQEQKADCNLSCTPADNASLHRRLPVNARSEATLGSHVTPASQHAVLSATGLLGGG